MAEASTSSKEEISFRTIYEKRIQRPLFLLDGTEKDLTISLNEGHSGNESFKKKDYKKALEHYNKGILFCPQNTDGALQILCELIGNRTKINMDLKLYDKVLKDVIYFDEIGKYSFSLKYIILWSKAKCYEARGDFKIADKYYDEALKLLRDNSNLTGDELQNEIKAIKYCKKNKRASTSNTERIRDTEKFEGSKKYPSLSPLVDIQFDDRLGRYAVAKENISVGTLIVKEDPHVALLDQDRDLTHCQVCFTYVDQLIIPCSTCANVVYCSNDCKKKADASFHKIECPIYPTLKGSFDKLMCLRILTQRGYAFFNEQKDNFLRKLESHYQGLTKEEVYRSDDYNNMLFLYRNVNQIYSQQIYDLNAAVYLLRVLKKTDFFPFKTHDEVLHDKELFIGLLILRHCQLLTCNVHEIAQLKYPNDDSLLKSAVEEENLIECIGSGLFTTLAFFNHSCDSSIIRYSDKTSMLVRTVKPIRAGEIIYDNYGPNYLFMELEDRQERLRENYFFQCTCPPCVEKWPMAASLQTVVKVPCKTSTCDFVFSVKRNRRLQICFRCREEPPIAEIQEITEAINHYYEDAEKLFQDKKFDDALKAYKTVLDMKYAHTNRPDLDIINAQERIKYIFYMKGNLVNCQ